MDRASLNVSPIGFGAFKIGRNEGIKYPDAYELPDDGATEKLLNGVLDLGINCIDTAPAYGSSEERIGRFIGHRRKEYVLSTKVGETFADGRSTYDFSDRAVRAGVHRSLTRLKSDVLDMVFVHAGREDVRVLKNTAVVPTLQALRDDGLIRFLGFSGYTPDAFELALEWADAIMVEYNPAEQSAEPIVDAAARRGTAVFAKKGLGSGRLAADESIRFVLSNAGVTCQLVGSLSIEHLRENVTTAACVRGERT